MLISNLGLGFVLLAIGLVNAEKLEVLSVEKCSKLEDTKCMIDSFQKAVPIFMGGIPALDIENLDVMDLREIQFDLSGLRFKLTEGKLKGLKTAVIDNAKWHLDKKKLEIKYHVNCTIRGHYKADGRILILPITGDGQLKIKLSNMAMVLFLSYEMGKGADGKEHIIIKDYNFTFDVKDNAQFGLTNLFNGNKQLSDTMLAFLNVNWKQISVEFGKPIVVAALEKAYKAVVTFFEKVPMEDLLAA